MSDPAETYSLHLATNFGAVTRFTMRHLLIVTLLALFGAASAADKPNFSGVWKMNLDKSAYGPVPPPLTFVRTVQHADPSITILEEQTGPGATPSTTRSMKTDGKPISAEISG